MNNSSVTNVLTMELCPSEKRSQSMKHNLVIDVMDISKISRARFALNPKSQE